MPIINIFGLSNCLLNHPKSVREIICRKIATAAASIPELKIEERHCSINFVSCIQGGSDGKVTIFVVGLFDKPERTVEVRRRLAQKLRSTISEEKRLWPIELIECFVKRFDPRRDGFASTDPDFIEPE